MKKLFLLISSIILSLNSNSCGPTIYYTEEGNKNFLITHLVTELELDTRLFPTTNSLYYKTNYSVYDMERDRQSTKLKNLGFSEDLIYLMNSNIVKSINMEHHFIKIEFNTTSARNISNIYELSISKFFDYKVIQKFEQKNQLDLLKFMMYRSIVLQGGKSSKITKINLRKFIRDEIKTCPKQLIKDYATLLIDLSLHIRHSHTIVSDYMRYFENAKKINPIAYSHFCGAVSAQYALHPTDKHFKYRNDRELSVYLFTKLLKHPKLYRKIIYEINYVIDLKSEFDWEKCLLYCKNQEERDKINLIKTSIFSGINISLIDYFKERTNENSKTFELALIQYTQRVESNLFTSLYSKGCFKEGYTVNSKSVNQYDYADAVDLNNYLKLNKIQNKVLLHILRGYSSFMLGNLSEARKEYQTSRNLLKKSSYLTKKQKNNFSKQIDGLELLEEFSRDNSEINYHNLQTRLTKLLTETYLSDQMETYFELGLNLAVKKHDFITALTFTSNKGFHQQIILDIIMDNNDLLKLLERINKEELPFKDRLPTSLKFAVIEQIATNYFRNHDLLNAEKYFDLLPDYIFEPGIGGRAYYDNKYGNFYSNFIINTSDTEKESLRRYNKKTAIKAILEITNEIKQKKSLSYINDSLSLLGVRKEISNLYYDLSCIYSSPFWAYSRIWKGSLKHGIWYAKDSPFNILKANYMNNKTDSLLNKYGSQNTSISYLNKAIEFSDEKERQAKLNFKLLKKLKKPFQTTFHKWRYNSDKLETIILDYETKKNSTTLLIDSLYQNTNYFKEVISECSNYRKVKNKTIINHSGPVTEHKDEQRDIYKILSLILLTIIITLFIYIKIKK
jgi:hypothetical protein